MPGVIAENQPAAKARKPTKNEQRRAKKKQQKQQQEHESSLATDQAETPLHESKNDAVIVEASANDSVQGVPAVANAVEELSSDDPLFSQYADVFSKFQRADEESAAVKPPEKPEVFYDDDENVQDEDEEAETQKKLSKKALKAQNKLSIAELKAIVRKPEIVEWTDISAQDPKLLVGIKSARNVVPVPGHWSLKREYLSSKRGIEKPAFALPKFIAELGISAMRDAVLEKNAEASMRQKQRERVQPKMNTLDIDYQKMYEAFHRRQTKPTLTRYGEIYFEGKEFETNLRHLRAGDLSDELREALNMPPAAPPPWLIAQQKFGPPPSYPALKIPGLNAPPPLGASWGFQPGGFGKPPVDDAGKPLWGGDVYGLGHVDDGANHEEASKAVPMNKTLWGELQAVQDEEEEEEDEEDEDEEEGDEDGEEPQDAGDDRAARGQSRAEIQFGTETQSGITSTLPSDLTGTQSSAEQFNLRKNFRGIETEDNQHPRSAGQVLHERSIRAEGFFGGDRVYDLGQGVLGGADDRGKKRKAGDVDVSLDPDALESNGRLSKDELDRQYAVEKAQGGGWQHGADREDFSNMVAEESAKRQKRDRERRAKR